MPYNGTGTFTRVYNWQTDKANGVKIRADRMDTEDDGFATGLSTAITKDGQTTITANLPMGGFKHTGVASASARTEYASAAQLQDNDLTFYATGGTGSAYTITPVPAISSLTAGQAWSIALHTISVGTTPTLQVSGLTAKTIINSDQTALANNALKASGVYRVQYDGTNYQLVNREQSFLSDGGTKTSAFDAAANTRYLVDNTTTAFTCNLGTVGGIVQIAKFGTFSLFLQGTVNGSASGLTITDEQTLPVTYTGASRGWV